MIHYPIQAAISSGVFDRVVVSTDSEQIAEVARSAGAETPFMRPASLADDHTVTAEVIYHAIQCLQDDDYVADMICCIYATAPLIQPKYLREGCDLMLSGSAESVFSVTVFGYPILRSMILNESGCLEYRWPEYRLSRSQDLPEFYHDAGQFYWSKVQRFLSEKRFLSARTMPVILPRYLVQDIDTPEDWETAEYMYEAIRAREAKHG